MLFAPKPLGKASAPREAVKADKKAAQRFAHCALGHANLYLGAFTLARDVWYVPLNSVDRVFKRLAVSRGFYEKGRLYGSIPYLVVRYDNGREKVCRFEHEEELDRLLSAIRRSTKIPVGKP